MYHIVHPINDQFPGQLTLIWNESGTLWGVALGLGGADFIVTKRDSGQDFGEDFLQDFRQDFRQDFDSKVFGRISATRTS